MENLDKFIDTKDSSTNLDKIIPNFERNTEIKSFLPKENGHWEEEKGDSKWIPDEDYIPKQGNPEGNTWGDILEEYGQDGVPFKDGYPVFDEFAVEEITIEDFSIDRSDNFAQADKECAEKWTEEQKDAKDWTASEVREYRKEEGLTWHEKEDQGTMQLVPTEVHNNIPHSGGIANKKADMATA